MPEQRLAFHQEHSQPIMDELHRWMTEQFDSARSNPTPAWARR